MSRPAERPSLHCILPDEAATERLAGVLARAMQPGLTVWLSGPLGVGKTTLVRGLLRALGHDGPVRSPTFTLMEPYELSRFALYHFDLYRFSGAGEWRDAGFEEFFGSDGVCLVEWPEQAGPDLPAPDLHLVLAFDEGTGEPPARSLSVQAFTDPGMTCLNALAAGC